MTLHSLTIPNWKPTSTNKLITSHWAVARKLKKADADIIAGYAIHQAIPKATGKRRLSFTVYVSGRGRITDADNCLKSLCDGLVKCGLLVDDSPTWMELGKMEVIRGGSATVIILEDITA